MIKIKSNGVLVTKEDINLLKSMQKSLKKKEEKYALAHCFLRGIIRKVKEK